MLLRPGAVEDVNDAPYLIHYLVQPLDHVHEQDIDFSSPFHIIGAELTKGSVGW